LSEHEGVEASVVVARQQTPGEKRLVAYLVPRQQPGPTAAELRSYLQQRLPEYMVPAAFVQLEALPLNPNGKVDRKALPAPDSVRAEPQTGYLAPQSRVEQTIATIWEQVLQVEKVGQQDNFFDLGGHSLLLLQVHSRLQQALEREVS